jgi:hypothetical protein
MVETAIAIIEVLQGASLLAGGLCSFLAIRDKGLLKVSQSVWYPRMSIAFALIGFTRVASDLLVLLERKAAPTAADVSQILVWTAVVGALSFGAGRGERKGGPG